ncbi:DUF559 domain-containing protein [Synechococcus sp. Nb3U1]|uniref:endonuclease domain-containing protein n=1 Tax=Synechococcus sp. Nb3U1 TaxID=1914529 RepID=UPI001F209237|nr:DUF559 domain-containing protein [Synechococcus sp. Nb3U1]MCF2972765.1 DUF559 domain-containing protein [Synechococcus sp. Nb3U1]
MVNFCWEELGNAGEVKVLSSPSVEQTLTLLAEVAEQQDEVLVSKLWHQVPAQETIIDECLSVLAKVALSLWPNWYGQTQWFTQSTAAEEIWLNHLRIQAISVEVDPSISTMWLKAVVPLCENNIPPQLTKLPRSLQVQQLIKAISPKGLTLALVTDDPQPRSMYLLGLAKAASWLADQSKVRVVLLVPTALAHHEELASIGYSALELQLPAPTEFLDTSVRVVLGQRGSPHPGSQMEQLLAKRIECDAELKGLFSFNQSIQTTTGQSFKVDLLWEEGKLIVELDGDEHRGRNRYTADRQRDYELVISGYLVLRISNDQVMSDCERVLEMIRNVVRLRPRSQALNNTLGA